MYPLKFAPILKSTLWGGDKIIPFKRLDREMLNVGESWEVSAIEGSESIVINGEDKGLTLTEIVDKYKEKIVGKDNYTFFGGKFPVLVKFLDTRVDLSVQVHPNDEIAGKYHNSFGKNELWYIISAKKNAKVISGFSREITQEECLERVNNGTFTEVLQAADVQAGDAFYIPAGRVHSIGAGVFMAEIQQTSDITYRIFDYNRLDSNGKPRELHVEQAMKAINLQDVHSDFHTRYESAKNEPAEIIATPYFTTSLYDMTDNITCDYSDLDSFVIFVCVEGACRLTDNEQNEVSLVAGETVLLPATAQEVTIIPENGGVKLLETYV